MSQLTFEEAYIKLEQTVKALEAGGVPLEEAARLFEEGLRLAQVCHQHLSTTELKITQLQNSFGEQTPLTGRDEEAEDDASD